MSTFRENFNSSSFETIKNTKEALFRLETTREEMYVKRDNFFWASARAEKAEKMLNLEDESERVELANKNAAEMKNSAIKASELYLTALAEEKQVWGDFDEIRKFCIDSLKESEESRIQFVKKMLEKHVFLEIKLKSMLLEEAKVLLSGLGSVNPSKEAGEFQANFLNIGQLAREEWTPYESWKKNMKEAGKDPLVTTEEWISSEIPYVPMQTSLALIKTVIYYLVPVRRRESVDFRTENGCVNEIDDTSLINLVQLLSNPKYWLGFIQIIEFRKYIGMVEKENMGKLEYLLSSILTTMLHSETFDYLIFYKIVMISHELFTFDSGKKFLFHYLSQHPIFKIQMHWKETIESVISARVVSEKELFYRNKQRLKKIGSKANSNKFSEKTAEKNSTIAYISQFNFYMVNLKVPIEIAMNVITDCSKKTKLEPDKIGPLILELHSLNPDFILEVSSKNKSLRVSSKTRGKWGAYLYLGISIEYLPRSDLLQLLLVCKSWNSIIRPYFLQCSLLVFKDLKFRKQAWEFALYKSSHKSYSKVLENLKKNPAAIKSVEDVIMMDILRSYNNKTNVNSDELRDVLRAYAFYQSKVGYCQGMNYIAGTLYIVFQDPMKAFWAMDELFRINSMYNLYCEDLPKLKFLFFALDRLIAYHLPNVHMTFNAEAITSSAFSSPWFLTLFGALLTSNLNILLEIWDNFIFVKFI